MSENSEQIIEGNEIIEGNFKISVTPSLRELFAHIQASTQRPMRQMVAACEVRLPSGKLDKMSTENNLLELMHHLHATCGVAIPQIAPIIRCFGERTKGVAMRLHTRDVRLQRGELAVAAEPQLLQSAPA